MIKAVSFDLDGTLIDSIEAIVQSFNHTFDVLGEPRPERGAILGSIGHVLEDQFSMLTRRDPKECAVVYREKYGEICCDLTTLMPGARESLERLSKAGLALGFATSKRRGYAERILAHLGVLDYFAVRLGPDDVARPKPNPDAVLRSLELFGVSPDELVYVGDLDFDVLASRAAGVACLCVTTGYAGRRELEALGPASVYDSLLEVTQHILTRLDTPLVVS